MARDRIATAREGAPRMREDEPIASRTGARSATPVTRVSDASGPRATDLPGLDLPPRFEPISLLGRGGMGFVVAARERESGREVAVKLLSPELRTLPDLRTRLLREGAALASLDHPSIVRVHEVDPEAMAIVMELVRGESLRARLDREGRLSPAEVRRIGLCLVSALEVAHAAGIVHRDVKPGNVLLGERGAVKLADFGVASIEGSDLTRAGSSPGTPSYMPPEQLRGQRVDARADVYALGVTLFEAATGTRLHRAGAIIEDPLATLLAATGDAPLSRAVERALRECPGDRWPTARDFAAALVAPTRRRRARALITAAATALAMIGLARDTPRPAEAAPPRGAIAMLPFDDRSGDPRLDFATSGLSNLLASDLESTRTHPVISYYRLLERVGPAAPRSAWLAEARRLGADRVIFGDLVPDRGQIRVRVVLGDAEGAEIRAASCRAAAPDVPSCVRSCGAGLAEAAGIGVATLPRERRPLDAEQALQRGIAAVEEHRFAEAEVWFLEARQIDPDSSEVAYHEALTSWWIERPQELTLQLIERAQRGDLRPAQRAFLDGLRLLVAGSYPAAVERFQTLAERYPAEPHLLYGLFEALYHAGHGQEAMAVYRRVVEISPGFVLGLFHVFEHAAAHADLPALDWVLARPHVREDRLYAPWIHRRMAAAGDFDGVIRLLQQQQQDDPSPSTLPLDLLHAHAVNGQISIAHALATQVAITDSNRGAIELYGLQVASGGGGGRFAANADRSATLPGLPAERFQAWLALALLELPSPDPARLREIRTRLEHTVAERRQEASLSAHVIRALLGGALGDDEERERMTQSPFPEAAAVAEAFARERAGNPAGAADAWERAVSLSIDGRFDVIERFFQARAARAAGDLPRARRVCEALLRPPVFSWAWASSAGHCLTWQAEAARAEGARAEERRLLTRLITLRAEAPPGDRLVHDARAALGEPPLRR